MFALAAVIIFAIAAYVAFSGGTLSVTGLMCIGLACLAVHLLWPVTFWKRG